jgi:hypothetical protein
MLDRQETFDRVLEHLREQREPSLRGAGLCAYRDSQGRMCAVGALIPEHKYDHIFEGYGAAADVILQAIPGADWDDREFLRGLQGIHDQPVMEYALDFMVAVEDGAKAFADKHGLEYDPPEELAQ